MGAVAYFASGRPLFIGVALIVVAVLVPFRARGHRNRVRGVVTGLIGGIGAALIALSATPFSAWFYALWGVAFFTWVPGPLIVWNRRPRLRDALSTSLILVSLTAAAFEWPHYRWPSFRPATNHAMCVIGDSISAGVGAAGEAPWPAVLATRHGIAVTNLAVAGATVRSAWRRQAPLVPDDTAVVFVEIGGNDVIAATPAADFAAALDELLDDLTKPDRLVVMCELPLPPLANTYGAAQRRTAARYNVVLLPKRMLADILGPAENTIDGLHLSKAGHEMLAEAVWRMMSPLFAQ